MYIKSTGTNASFINVCICFILLNKYKVWNLTGRYLTLSLRVVGISKRRIGQSWTGFVEQLSVHVDKLTIASNAVLFFFLQVNIPHQIIVFFVLIVFLKMQKPLVYRTLYQHFWTFAQVSIYCVLQLNQRPAGYQQLSPTQQTIQAHPTFIDPNVPASCITY